MEKIIDAVPAEDIMKELTEDCFVRKTNFGHNEIYIVNAHNAPNTMREIGRLRELAFREAGGGTGKTGQNGEFSHVAGQMTADLHQMRCLPGRKSAGDTVPVVLLPELAQINVLLKIDRAHQFFQSRCIQKLSPFLEKPF